MMRPALALAKKGMFVFPCTPRGKTPAVPGGCNAATNDEETIARWWQLLPDANIAIATGAPSNIFALDVDGIDAEAELRRLEENTVRCQRRRKSSPHAAGMSISKCRTHRSATRRASSDPVSISGPPAVTFWHPRAFTRPAADTSGASTAPARSRPRRVG